MLGAKAEAKTEAISTSSPPRITGRRPKESDSGPAVISETAQAPKVTVANCPATATDTSRSEPISFRRGGSMNTEFWAPTMAKESTAKNHALFTCLPSACAVRVTMLPFLFRLRNRHLLRPLAESVGVALLERR